MKNNTWKGRGKKSSNQQNHPEMDQQQQEQLQQWPTVQLSPLQLAAVSATPAAAKASGRPSSTPPGRNTGLMQPPVNPKPSTPVRAGTPQVPLNTQDSG